jgi:hypothetical protein
LIGNPTLLTALEALLTVLPPGVPSAGKKKPDASLAGAANDFEAPERLRKLAFAGNGACAENSGTTSAGFAGLGGR